MKRFEIPVSFVIEMDTAEDAEQWIRERLDGIHGYSHVGKATEIPTPEEEIRQNITKIVKNIFEEELSPAEHRKIKSLATQIAEKYKLQ